MAKEKFRTIHKNARKHARDGPHINYDEKEKCRFT